MGGLYDYYYYYLWEVYSTNVGTVQGGGGGGGLDKRLSIRVRQILGLAAECGESRSARSEMLIIGAVGGIVVGWLRVDNGLRAAI